MAGFPNAESCVPVSAESGTQRLSGSAGGNINGQLFMEAQRWELQERMHADQPRGLDEDS